MKDLLRYLQKMFLIIVFQLNILLPLQELLIKDVEVDLKGNLIVHMPRKKYCVKNQMKLLE